MPTLDRSLTSEAFFGAVYGLGLSIALWAGTSAEHWLTGGIAALGALAFVGGPLRIRLRDGWRIAAPLPFAFAAASIAGGPASILVAAAAGSTTGLVDGRRGRGWGRARASSFHAGSAVLAAAAAALAAHAAGGGERVGWGAPVATLAWVAAWTVTHGTIMAGAMVLVTDLPVVQTLARVVRDESRSCVLVVPLGLALPFVLASRWGATALASAFVVLLIQRHARRPLERWWPRSRDAGPPVTIYRSITSALARALAAGDDTTGDHLQRVRRLCLSIGSRLGMTRDELEALGAAALLHDVGRIAVPDRIRAKPGQLTDSERARVRMHPAVGAEIVRALRFPFPVHPIVRHHHERWDGTGYPDRLHGEEIPFGARILAAVHAYDALVSERPYRGALDHDAALRTIRGESGTAFDPLVVDLLAEELDREAPTRPSSTRAVLSADDRDERAAAHMVAADRRLAVLYDLRRLSRSHLPCEDRLAAAVRRLGDVVPHDAVALWRGDSAPDDGAVFAGGLGRRRLATESVDADGGLAATALAERRAVAGTPRWAASAGTPDERTDDDGPRFAHGACAPLVDDGVAVGVLALYRDEGPFDDEERRTVAAAAGALTAALVAAAPAGRPDTILTDPASGLPNTHFLRCEAAHRFAGTPAETGRSGMIAIRLGCLQEQVASCGEREGERVLAAVGRRIAAALGPGETLVRHGVDVLLVLTAVWRPDALARRANELEHAADFDGLRPRAAHVAFPRDGSDLGALLAALGRRLEETGERTRAVVPFRTAGARAS